MADNYRKRRIITAFITLIGLCLLIVANTPNQNDATADVVVTGNSASQKKAMNELAKLEVKGRAPKTGYSREMFGSDWLKKSGCSMRDIILNRDMTNVAVDTECSVSKGALNDPYTGKVIDFVRGSDTGADVHIDHVVALSDAWQKGAQLLDQATRLAMANDPIELLAVDAKANMQKGDGDAATWLPSNKSFRCQYVARQIAVKVKYKLWVTAAERDAIKAVLGKCQDVMLPSP